MIRRALIHVGGPPGAGKTAFIERLVAGCRHWVFAVRCRRNPTLLAASGLPGTTPGAVSPLRRGRKRGRAVQTGSRTPIGKPARALRIASLER
jgi:hypothetical protein